MPLYRQPVAFLAGSGMGFERSGTGVRSGGRPPALQRLNEWEARCPSTDRIGRHMITPILLERTQCNENNHVPLLARALGLWLRGRPDPAGSLLILEELLLRTGLITSAPAGITASIDTQTRTTPQAMPAGGHVTTNGRVTGLVRSVDTASTALGSPRSWLDSAIHRQRCRSLKLFSGSHVRSFVA